MGKIIIKEALDAILKKNNRLNSEQYVALLTQFHALRDSCERNRGSMRIVAERDAESLQAVTEFLFEAHMVNRDQREQLWSLIDEISDENE